VEKNSGVTTGFAGVYVVSGKAAGTEFYGVHVWGPDDYAWYLATASDLYGCKGEGADISQLVVHGKSTQVYGGGFYDPDQDASGAAIHIGDTGIFPSHVLIDTKVRDHAVPIHFAVDSGWGVFRLQVEFPEGVDQPAYTGSPQDSSRLDITATGPGVNVHERNGANVLAGTFKVWGKTATDFFKLTDGANVDQMIVSSSGVKIGSGGTAITKHLSSTKTWDPASTADGAVDSTTLTVTGAAIGNTVTVGHSVAIPAGALLVGAVTATNTVTVTLFNKTGAPLDVASGTLRADVWQH
jgi:hypothetical protein